MYFLIFEIFRVKKKGIYLYFVFLGLLTVVIKKKVKSKKKRTRNWSSVQSGKYVVCSCTLSTTDFCPLYVTLICREDANVIQYERGNTIIIWYSLTDHWDIYKTCSLTIEAPYENYSLTIKTHYGNHSLTVKTIRKSFMH